MSIVVAVLILIIVVICVVAFIYCLSNKKKQSKPEFRIEEGVFMWLDQQQWAIPPIVPLSQDTLLGSLSFENERYDPQQDTLSILYKGRTIEQNQAWVIRGKANKLLEYWGFSLFKLHDNRSQTLKSIGYGLNKEMVKDTRNNDDLVIVVSPNYKLGEFIANRIHQEDYNKHMHDDRHVIFTYVPIPYYDPSAKYTYLFEATKNASGMLPKFSVYRYTYLPAEINIFPFYPVEKKVKIKTITDHTVDETKDLDIFDRQMESSIKQYRTKVIAEFVPPHNLDYLYTDSGILEVQSGETITVGVIDHSSNGKCVYSELLFVNATTGLVYDSRHISSLDPISVDPNGKIKIFSSIVPINITSVRVYERIVVDVSTRIGPDPKTIVPARIFVIGNNNITNNNVSNSVPTIPNSNLRFRYVK